jgi:hypothetical protein
MTHRRLKDQGKRTLPFGGDRKVVKLDPLREPGTGAVQNQQKAFEAVTRNREDSGKARARFRVLSGRPTVNRLPGASFFGSLRRFALRSCTQHRPAIWAHLDHLRDRLAAVVDKELDYLPLPAKVFPEEAPGHLWATTPIR